MCVGSKICRGPPSLRQFVVFVCVLSCKKYQQCVSRTREYHYPTHSTVPSGPPLSLEVVVGVNDVTFTWSLPEVTLRNGIITGFTLSCFSGGSLMARRTLTEPGSHTVTGLSADTEYNCSVVATNSMGSGPPATLALRTQSAPTDDSMCVCL